MRIPMPSPKNTNREGLYLTGALAELVARQNPAGAYDSPHGLHGLAYDDYTPPQDDVATALVGLLDLLKRSMKPDDYKKAEIAVGNIMKLSRERLADHHAQLNEANSDATSTGGPPDFGGKPPPPAQDARPAGLRALLRTPAASSMANMRKLLDARDTSTDSLARAKAHAGKIGIL